MHFLCTTRAFVLQMSSTNYYFDVLGLESNYSSSYGFRRKDNVSMRLECVFIAIELTSLSNIRIRGILQLRPGQISN